MTARPSQNEEPSITLYTSSGPNGMKISITLEELNLPYTVRKIDATKHEQKQPWYLAINPNGRIPALTDTLPDGTPLSLFESAGIMHYLIDRYDAKANRISYPRGTPEYYEMCCWLAFMNAGVGPMQGQAIYFKRYAPEKAPHVLERYQGETRRLYRVLEKQLGGNESGYLVGDRCTIADIAHFGYISAAGWAGIDINEFPNLVAWEERMLSREGVEKGRNVPDPHRMKEMLANEKLAKRVATVNARWVLEGQGM